MGSPENTNNWVFDYSLIEDLPPLDAPNFAWPSHSFSNAPTPLSSEFEDLFANSNGLKDAGSRKRTKPGPCDASGSKACREKVRRDKLNDRFLELGAVLEPGRPPKMDKAVILGDAVRMVTQLRNEALKLKESNQTLQHKITELKAEKNELRDEKQRLKTEKDVLDKQVKALTTQPGFMHAPAMPPPFPALGKLVPFVGYPGISMWQFMPPAALDTSQDHVLRPPVA